MLHGVGFDSESLGSTLLHVDPLRSLAFDPGTGTLFTVDVSSDQLQTIDTSTGLATNVGPVGSDFINSLTFDPMNGALYGGNSETNELFSIDPATGATTLLGELEEGLFGLAFAPEP